MLVQNQSPVKIYGDLRIRAFRVVWMCEELGLSWELEETFPWTDKMYAVNPLGKVPVLIDGDVQVYESAAILNYLAEKYQKAAKVELIPEPGTKERAYYDQFLMVIFNDIESLGLWTHRKFIDLPQYTKNPELMEKLQYVHIPQLARPAKSTFDRSLKVLASQLKNNNFLLGDKFTALDIHFLIDLEWAEALNWLSGNSDEDLLTEYYDRVRMRDAYKKCWKMRQPLDLSRKAHNTFTPQNQKPPKGL